MKLPPDPQRQARAAAAVASAITGNRTPTPFEQAFAANLARLDPAQLLAIARWAPSFQARYHGQPRSPAKAVAPDHADQQPDPPPLRRPRALSPKQIQALRKLRDAGQWSSTSTWRFGPPSLMAQLLDALVRRGLAHRTIQADQTIYRPTKPAEEQPP
jgi:hypothetical protein